MLEKLTQRPTWAEIDLENLAFNFRSAKRFIGSHLKYMAVVKADGYGHGAVPCAKRLEAEGVDWFGVVLPEEGMELRHAGIRKLILCLGGFWDGQASLALNHNLTPVVYQKSQAEALNDEATRHGTAVAIHVKVDTGMGRIGFRHDEIPEFARALRDLDHLRLEGVMTHFAAADDLTQTDFTELQIKRLNDAVGSFHEMGFNPSYVDLANSPGAVAHPTSRGNMVRLGGILYGLGGDVLPGGIDKPELKPVLSLRTRIAHLKTVPAGETIGYGRTFTTARESLIATIPIGYRDGYRRSLSNIGRVIVRGVGVPVVGRVSMDWTTLDVSGVDAVSIGDEVVLIGQQDNVEVRAEDIAAATETISYEVTCGIGQRVPRIYRPPNSNED